MRARLLWALTALLLAATGCAGRLWHREPTRDVVVRVLAGTQAANQPVAGAHVRIFLPEGYCGRDTDRDGMAVCRLPRSATDATVEVRATGCAPWTAYRLLDSTLTVLLLC